MQQSVRRLMLSTHDFYHLIDINQILYCRSNNSYTTLFLTSNEEIKTSTSIKEMERQLINENFIRPHQSYLVNIQFIKAVSKINACKLILKNGCFIPVSSRKKNKVLQLLEKSTRIQE
ncbi:MAG: LytTR family DNA-binding domain-containing protein [Candidatus Paceibacterota bacterium]